MKRFVQLFAVLSLFAALTSAQVYCGAAYAQDQSKPAPTAANGAAPQKKDRVQGYTRANRKTGEPVQVRTYKRRPPKPKPVEVRPYLRNGQPVKGHVRQPPATDHPAVSNQ